MADRQLIWKYNRGKKEVLRQIYEKYKDDLVTLAAILLNEKVAAEDTVHDVFVTFIKSAVRLPLTGNLKGYLAVCVANSARNKNKVKQRQQSITSDQAETLSTDSDGPDTSAIDSEELRRLIWSLGRLPYEQREVIMLHLYSGMKFKAIAKLESVSINTIQGRYRYGLNKLRSLLNGEVTK